MENNVMDALFNDEQLGAASQFAQAVQGKNDGLYRIDMSKVTDKSKGYRAVIRLLPNITKERKLGKSSVEKITHYVNIKAVEGLSGYYDSPKNFGEKCLLSETYYKLDQSKNQLLKEKAKLLNYSKNYYSYALVISDEQQPELVGKIVIFKYGITIKEKIEIEDRGEISGVRCNVFSLEKGKDLVLIVTENEVPSAVDPSKTNKFPDYKQCAFRPMSSSISLPVNGEMKNVPIDADGKIKPELQSKIAEFLLNREVDLSDFEPKVQTAEIQDKVRQIVGWLTGESMPSNTGISAASQPAAEDFDFGTATKAPVAPSTGGDAENFDFNF